MNKTPIADYALDPSDTLSPEARYKVEGYGGIAFYYEGLEGKATEDTEWDGIYVPTGMVVMVMVGDDREHIIDPDDCTEIAEDDYCPECGQIGCEAYR